MTKRLAPRAILEVHLNNRRIRFKTLNFPNHPLGSAIGIELIGIHLDCVILQYCANNIEGTTVILDCHSPDDYEKAWEMATAGDNTDCRTWPEVINFATPTLW